MTDSRKIKSALVIGTLQVLEAARRHRARRFVFSSSRAVYGDAPEIPIFEDEKLKPI